MANIPEIKEALNLLVSSGTNIDDIVVLHATTEYPAPFEEVNLRAMQTIKESLNVKVGYSDHTAGIEVAIAAAALGAEIIEKHFTTDKNLPGPDHLASLVS
jgi:N,N'-diacetyllegionaminate synthase